jgi:hypothetical protein
MSDKWKQPDAPPSPLFAGEKERNLVKQVNDELIERVVGQQVVYYPIDLERTAYHDIYGEAIVKTFLPPVRVYALVQWDGLRTVSENVGMDKETSITINFHKRRLTEDQDLYVREGDFVLYGKTYYEITSLIEPKQLFGQIEHKFEISAKCTLAREGMFDAT